jgi:glycosyltransferase involved in cell wall biosynthesis
LVTTASVHEAGSLAGEDPAACTRIVALLGRRDEPTDALRDYCARLGEGLRAHGSGLEAADVLWDRHGWLMTLAELWKQSARWKGRWVLLQYTALMWSRRGFPLAIPILLWILKLRGCRTAVVFHDVYSVPGPRRIDRFRVALQRRIMRYAYRQTSRSIVPIPLNCVPWLPREAPKAVFIPVGANIPSLDDLLEEGFAPVHGSPLKVAAFAISSWPATQKQEVEAIIHSMSHACSDVGELHLVVMGRGAKEVEQALRDGLSRSRVLLTVEGLLKSRDVSTRLCECDVLLFVRGPFSSQRGSGLAGIACGLPIVAYEGRETGFPLTEAGILFAPQNDLAALADQLVRILRDSDLRRSLCVRNQTVFREWFAWDRIAGRLVESLAGANADSSS